MPVIRGHFLSLFFKKPEKIIIFALLIKVPKGFCYVDILDLIWWL
jgi:hypothetical protein